MPSPRPSGAAEELEDDCAEAGTPLLVSLPLAPNPRGTERRMAIDVHLSSPERERGRERELGGAKKDERFVFVQWLFAP